MNVHLIPTEKYSPLVYSTSKYGGLFPSTCYSPMKDMGDSYQHLYITSDEEIKKGDWHLKNDKMVTKSHIIDDTCKKIILTTDQDLIEDGVQAIDDEFLEWFVKNPSCESVDVNCELGSCLNCEWNHDMCPNVEECLKNKYMIIIPQEEPKQQTIEEAAERYYGYEKSEMFSCFELDCKQEGFEQGAKWQQERMYSEEEVVSFIHKFLKEHQPQLPYLIGGINMWFGQYKKK